jgi:rubrerythrin
LRKEDLISRLRALAQLDIDAFHAYGQVIDKATYQSIRENFTRFQEDHRRHVEEISALIREMGQDPPEFSHDFKGFLLEGFTSLRSLSGTQGALAGMRTNEKMTNRRYREATELDVPPDVRRLLGANYEDEQKHLAYIEDRLDFLVREGDASGRSQRY